MTAGFNMRQSQSNIEYAQTFAMEIPWVVSLGEVSLHARYFVGEKTYRLAKLAQAGFQVPRGYCITVSGYRQYLANRDNNLALPKDLSEEILQVHRSLNLSTVAVRSSALDEDLNETSAAGIYPTYLNVMQENDLLSAIANCFNACNCEQARRYRHLHRHDDETDMAVLVQAQVEASSAGILFTADPITGDPNYLHINAILGLGEPLTSGELTPDHYVQDRSGNLVRQTIAMQPWMHTVKGQQPVPLALQNQPVLNPSQLSQLNHLAQRIEQHEQVPVDIEFAFDAFGLQLLQARPITSTPFYEQQKLDRYLAREEVSLKQRISLLRRRGRIKQSNSILSNGNIAELLPSPTPMSFELFNLIFAGHNGAIAQGRRQLGYQVDSDVCDGLFQLVAGQPFFLLEIDAHTYDIGLSQPIARIHETVRQNPSLANYPELGLYEQLLNDTQAERHYPVKEALMRVQARKNFNRLQRKHTDNFDDEAMAAKEQRWRDYLQHNKAVRLNDLELPQLTSHLDSLVSHLQQDTCKEFVSVARLGFYFYELCRVRMTELSKQDQDIYLTELFQGLQKTPISEQYQDLEKVRDGSMTMGTYLSRYGHLSTNELEVSLPRYHEDPQPLQEQIRARTLLAKPTTRSHQKQRTKRIISERSLRADHFPLSGNFDFWRDLRLAQRFLPLREQVKYFFLAEYDLVRSTLLEIESRLNLESGDIFYLRPQEVGSCSDSPDQWRETIYQRRQEHQLSTCLARQHRMPAVLFEDNLQQLGAEQPLNPSTSWRGQAVSPGFVEGFACVVETMEEAGKLKMELGPDQILVIPSLNLGLSALLGNLGGLIVETGGLLAHSACQARERGIPAAVLPGATVQLQNGDRIRLDGANGLIQMA